MNFWRRNPARPGAAGSERVTALDDLWLTVPLNFEAIHACRFIFRDLDFLMREPNGDRQSEDAGRAAYQVLTLLTPYLLSLIHI